MQGTYGSVLLVGDKKYVVAREHVSYVQDHFPLQQERSANPELEWLHRLLARNNDNDIVSEFTELQAGMATDPSSFIKRHFSGFGGSWGVAESYHVDKDVYKLRYGVDGYTEKLAFEDVITICYYSLPLSPFSVSLFYVFPRRYRSLPSVSLLDAIPRRSDAPTTDDT